MARPTLMEAIRIICVLVSVTLLQACGTVHNTVRDGGDERLMLRGNDPVAYFTEDRPVKGDPRFRSVHSGDTYRFASEGNKRAFDAAPERYVPAYGGFCASGVHYGLKAAILADVHIIHKGRLFLFGSPRSRANWLMDADDNIRLGDRYWEEELKDAPYRLQNWKRYVFKVPHYRTDRQLDAEHLRRYGKLPPGAPPPER